MKFADLRVIMFLAMEVTGSPQCITSKLASYISTHQSIPKTLITLARFPSK